MTEPSDLVLIYFIVMIIDLYLEVVVAVHGDDSGGGWWAVTHQIQTLLVRLRPDSSGGWDGGF